MSDDVPAPVTPEEDSEAEEEVPESGPEVIDLPSGRELDIGGAELIVGARPTRLIVIAGPVDCGKTTLLTSIYESFQYGGFGNCQFVASETLPGFERRCFLSRVASGRDVPETARTRIGDPAFLHLRVSFHADPRQAIDILLTDLSGEAFRQARDVSEECERLDFLGRADHVVLLIDGEKLVNPRTRWSTPQECLSLFQSLLDNKMLAPAAHVEVLVSKWDFVVTAPNSDEIKAQIEGIEEKFRTRFESRVGRLRFAQVAARPKAGCGLSFAHGVSELFEDWLNSSPWLRSPDLESQIAGCRESEKFATRQLPKVAKA